MSMRAGDSAQRLIKARNATDSVRSKGGNHSVLVFDAGGSKGPRDPEAQGTLHKELQSFARLWGPR